MLFINAKALFMRFYFLSINFVSMCLNIVNKLCKYLLSCQPRVTVTSCFVYKVIRDLETIDNLCINPPIHRIGLIHINPPIHRIGLIHT